LRVSVVPWEKENLERIANEIGLVDVFQQLKPYAKGRKRFTFYERPSLREAGKGWRLDYYLADPALMVRDEHKLHVTDIQVLEEYKGSDHVPVMLLMRRPNIVPREPTATMSELKREQVPEDVAEVAQIEEGGETTEIIPKEDLDLWVALQALASDTAAGHNSYLDARGNDLDCHGDTDTDPTQQHLNQEASHPAHMQDVLESLSSGEDVGDMAVMAHGLKALLEGVGETYPATSQDDQKAASDFRAATAIETTEVMASTLEQLRLAREEYAERVAAVLKRAARGGPTTDGRASPRMLPVMLADGDEDRGHPRTHSVPITRVKMNGKETPALWDSGSSCCLLNESMARALLGTAEYNRRLKKPKGAPQFQLADGSISRPMGEIEFDVAPSKKTSVTFRQKFWILQASNTNLPLILGVDFFRKARVLLDFWHNRIFIFGKPMIVIPFELTQSRNTRELEVNVCMEEDTVIPARSRWMYKAALRGQAAATIRSGDHDIVARDDLLARHPLLQLGARAASKSETGVWWCLC